MNPPTRQPFTNNQQTLFRSLWSTGLAFSIGMASLLLLLRLTAHDGYAQENNSRQMAPTGFAPTFSAGATGEMSQPTTVQIAALDTDDQVHISRAVVSPNGRFAAVTIVPLGNETAFLARTQIYDIATNKVRQILPGYLPKWLDSRSTLQLETMDRGLVIYEIDEEIDQIGDGGASFIETRTIAPTTAASSIDRMTETQQSPRIAAGYPTTIRVAHHPSNGCRDLPEWQVDTIPFEEYVARVVPAETPSWWPIDALAAQAVAARTYAWRQILVGRADYDVTDWANFQMMCDARYPNSDSASSMTQGQYLVALDDGSAAPISAMYSAENGHPTLTNSNVSYLQSVPDRFALGRVRYGHGYGLSQWGAYRRAVAGQTYRQILGHYYSNIYLRNGLEPTQVLGTLLDIDPAHSLAIDSITLRAMRAPGLAAIYRISATAGLTETLILESKGGSQEAISWRAVTPLAEGSKITASLWISGQVQDQVTWLVDHQQPARPSLPVPLIVTTTHFTLTVPLEEESATPLLSAGWQWAGSALDHTAHSGAIVAEPQSATGTAWAADPALHNAGVWYGPKTTVLAAGHSYRALFWLRTTIPPTETTMTAPLARLDVTDNDGVTLLGLRDLRASDFVANGAYTPIAVDFHLFDPPSSLEFRVHWPGTIGLAYERVEIWQLPDRIESQANRAERQWTPAVTAVAHFGWSVAGYGVEHLLQLRASDRAGNLSAVQPLTVTVIDEEPPTFGSVTGLREWITSKVITLSTTASDTLSGIDLTTGTLRISKDAFISTPPLKIDRLDLSSTSATLSANFTNLSDGIYTATFAINDQAGNGAQKSHPLRVDTTGPTVTIASSGQVSTAWNLDAVTVTIGGADGGSGVREIYYTQQTVLEPLVPSAIYTTPLQLNEGGIYTITAWAIDKAGNQSSMLTTHPRLDLLPPTLAIFQRAVNSMTVHIDWQADDDGSGVSAVEFELQRDESGWQPLTDGVGAVEAARYAILQSEPGIEITVDPQQQTRLRGRAADGVGRIGDWVELTLWAPTDWIFLPLISR